MPALRFILAADLHLDTAFPGLARDVSADLARGLHEATFTALSRLVTLCEEERPDFLILAGDVYNQEDLSLRAQLAVRDACETLRRLGIKVFLAHGNHDPLSSRLQTLQWPDNVTVFGSRVESVAVYRPEPDGGIMAVVHGVSHASAKETRNLAAGFSRTDDACPQIGVLHTTLGAADGEARYAPCSVADLASSGLDFWALGHIHEYSTVSREPLAVYPGSAQGLNINEQGPHGCVLVSMEAAPEGGWKAVAEFRPLAPVGWRILSINLEENSRLAGGPNGPENRVDGDDADDIDGADNDMTPQSLPRLERLIRTKLAAAADDVWPGCETLVTRVRLIGRTPLDADLRRLSVRAELTDALREGWEHGDSPRLWLKDLEVDTRPALNRDAALKREDLLGEMLRRADMWKADPHLLAARADEALGDLFSRGRSRKALAGLEANQLAALLEEAESLCADFLENN